ncbi:MAG: RluA family pseudouridine synthase [Candidatus Levybacteria bacterium]|nr:RluA family pseudouridine synthase [Candidatus Levybacteria bacterium]
MGNKSSTFSGNINSKSKNPLRGKKVLGKLKIIFENKDYLVIDKQSAVTVNRSDTTGGEVTLQDLIDEYVQNTQIIGKSESQFVRNDSDVEFRKRSGIVHRLDRETSGILIVAKNPASFKILQSQFKERKVEKSYIALVHGKLSPSQGEINVPIGRLPWNRKRFGVLAGGRNAETAYRVISNLKFKISNGRLSLVRLFPKTGRTHQIRVHLKYINHPIFADPLYAGRKTSREDRKLLPRIFLHAEGLSFFEPSGGEKKTFRSELPSELKRFLDSLEKVVN